jgi:hypothetical protein
MGRGGGVKFFDLVTGLEVLSLGKPLDSVSCLAFSRDGRRLAVAQTFGGQLSQMFPGNTTPEVRVYDATQERR